MLNHTYTSVKNANLVDCGKKQHIASQPSTLVKENFLGEFRTELDKKKVLANLGIATELSLEWKYIKGEVSSSDALVKEFEDRTTYVSKIDNVKKSLIAGMQYLETIIGGEQDAEAELNSRLAALEESTTTALNNLTSIQEYLDGTVKIELPELKNRIDAIDEVIKNINSLIQVSTKSDNALQLLTETEEGVIPGLYVPDLSSDINLAHETIGTIQSDIINIKNDYVTKELLGGGDFNFVKTDTYQSDKTVLDETISKINTDLSNTVKTGEDGHVNTLHVNAINKDNEGNIKISDSFEVTEGIPLDVRFVVETLEDLLALPVNKCYSGMGVIINSLSALYILRKPGEGITFNLEYVSNIYNWKCPEDLVTVALTRTEYEKLEEINPNVFYYIYEEEISRTKEPVRENFDTDEEFSIAWQEWVQSLKVLSQEYMSASWGVEIEEKLGKKASQDSITFLLNEVDKIKGSGDGTSLESLNVGILELQTKSNNLESQIINILDLGTETGRLVNAESRIKIIEDSLPDYITEEELTTLSGGFDFVKPDVYETDKQTLLNNLAESITTNLVVTNSIQLTGDTITSSEGNIKVNDLPLAKISDLPVILVMSQEDYNNLPSKDDDTYYYTYDDDVIYVTKLELDTKVGKLQQDIATLIARIETLENLVEQLSDSNSEIPDSSES